MNARIYDIGESVYHWLFFQQKLRKDKILSELLLRFPIFELLNTDSSLKVDVEKQYNSFVTRRADFYLEDINTKTKAIIECKWLRNSTNQSDKQRYFDDIYRMAIELRNELTTNDHAYFILAGRTRDLIDFIINTNEQPTAKKNYTVDKFFAKLLPFKLGKEKVVKLSRKGFFKNNIEAFHSTYIFKEQVDSAIPSFSTKLICRPYDVTLVKTDKLSPIFCYCWEITII